MTDNFKGYFWVIGGGLLQLSLIEEVTKLGNKVIVTDADPNCVCRNKSSYFKAIDIFDIAQHINYANELIEKGLKIVGVLAAGIDAPETMARVAEHLHLPTVSSDIAHLVNNKDLFRQKMQSIELPVPKYSVVDEGNIDELDSIIKDIGYPLIVKNTSSSGSRGTKIFYSPDFTGVHLMIKEAIKVSRSSKALIESLWEGSEHTVETIFDIEGNFHPCFITDRLFDKSNGFALETGLIHPSRLTTKEQEEMFLLAEKVSNKIGIKIGAAKFDIIQTNNGPRIIEMTVRLSGGFDCQYLVPAATGKNILKAAILTACGKSFSKDLLEDNKNKVALSESLWPKPGKIIGIEGLDEAKKHQGFEKIFFKLKIGDYVESYEDCTKRVCFIIASGLTYKEAKRSMSNIKKSIKIAIS